MKIKILTIATALIISGSIIKICFDSDSSNNHATSPNRPKNHQASSIVSKETINQSTSEKSSAQNKASRFLDPGEARKLLSEAKSIINLTDKSKYCSKIIEDLCKSGYSEEAWSLIESNPGQVREWQISAFFKNSHLSEDQIRGKFRELTDHVEITSGIRALMDRHKDNDLVSFLTSDHFKMLQKETNERGVAINISKYLSPVLQSYIWDNGSMSLSDQKEKMSLIKVLYQNNFLDQATITDIIKSSNLLSASEKLEFMDSLGDLDSRPTSLQAYRRHLISEKVRENPKAAISSALSQNESHQTTMDISNIVRTWIISDSHAATEWYNNNSSSLRSSQKDAAASSFYAVAMDGGDYDIARAWINEMTDPKMKAGSLKFLETTLQKKKEREEKAKEAAAAQQ